MEPRDWARRRLIRRLVASGVVLSVTTVGALGAIQLAGAGSSNVVTLPIDQLPQGASAQYAAGVPLVLVRHGDSVHSLEAISGMNLPVKLCRLPSGDQLLVDELGSIFDLDGTRLGGPSVSLDGFRTTVDGRVVRVEVVYPAMVSDPDNAEMYAVADRDRWVDHFNSPSFCPTVSTTH